MSTPTSGTCLRCGHSGLQIGYLEDSAQKGTYTQWYEGPLELNGFGDVRHWRDRARYLVLALRCPQCGHLELSTGDQYEY